MQTIRVGCGIAVIYKRSAKEVDLSLRTLVTVKSGGEYRPVKVVGGTS
jgi:hypothetical protein